MPSACVLLIRLTGCPVDRAPRMTPVRPDDRSTKTRSFLRMASVELGALVALCERLEVTS
jgi:hypothetical protein